ncbi:dead deah box helicase domain-containing protein [Cystoisospora suis]|uniref:Dead deah box helicase domain-containing protein n=1 Tax=Cystoisospora suis TaxID=483139 RepID=A0A2C6KN34_9APIC|nr:dead deah box helicase domain-containing protein [Cystoisospora suis]
MAPGRVQAANSRFAAPSSVCLYGNDSDFWTSDDEEEEEEEDEGSSSSSQQVPVEGSRTDARLKPGVSQIPSPGSNDSFLDKLGSPEQLAVPPPDAQCSFFPVLPSPYAPSFYQVSSRKEVYPWRQEDEENLLRCFGMLQGNDEDVKTEGNSTTTSSTHQRETSPSSPLSLQSSAVSIKASATDQASMFSSSEPQKDRREQQGKSREEGGLRFLPSAPCDVSTVNKESVLASWEEDEEDLGGGARGKREGRLGNLLSPPNENDLLPPFSSSVKLGDEEDGGEEGEERSQDTTGIQFFFFPPLNSEASNLLFNPFSSSCSSSSSEPCQENEQFTSYLNKPPPPLVEILPPQNAFPYFSKSVPAVDGRDEHVLEAPPLSSQSSPCERKREDDEELQAKATALASIEALCVTAPHTPTSSSSLSSSAADALATTVLSSPSPTADDQALSSSTPLAQHKTGLEGEKKVSPATDKLKAPRGGYIRKHWCVEDNTSDVTHFRRKLQAVRRERARILSQTEEGMEGGGNRNGDPSKTKKTETDGNPNQAAGGGESDGHVADSLEQVNENGEGETHRGEKHGEEEDEGEHDDEALGDGGVEICYDDLDDTMKSWLASIPQEPGDLSPLQVPLALEFPFLLDDFQKRAILHLEKYQTVFVAAHTSAGKTVVAEYAIALAIRRNRRCIYTSPLKALSNQKYREFRLKFPSVGIITGDVCINPDANCLIVTTEILRSLLYRGDALIGLVDTVIFDEAHYVNDLERGVVWEESIILLPREINMILLSATLPNYRQFADWVGSVKQREVFTLSTNKRPTPLRHYLWFHEKSFLLMDAKGKFQAGAYNEAFKHVRDKNNSTSAQKGKHPSGGGGDRGGGRGGRGGRGGGSGGRGGSFSSQSSSSSTGKNLFQTNEAKLKTEIHRLQGLITKLEKDGELPVVVFCFSRRKCEVYAQAMRKLNVVLSHNDRSKIHLFVKECLMALSPGDRDLPQIRFVCSLVQRGIGIHHGGLLPIIKEMVEILFQRGLVRVLFATETLAIGLNMPARSVVFSSLTKHDGQRSRMLHASEYTQMAGRAGRRGIDTFGHVYIFCADEIPDPKELTGMMIEKANPLYSRFRLTYQTLLLLSARRDVMTLSSFLSKSFMEANRTSQIPVYKRDLKRKQKELRDLPEIDCIHGEPAIEELAELEYRNRHLSQNMHMKIWQNRSAASSVFCPGRVAIVHSLFPSIKTSCESIFLDVDFRPLVPSEPPTFKMLVLLPSWVRVADLVEQSKDRDQKRSKKKSAEISFPPVTILASGVFPASLSSSFFMDSLSSSSSSGLSNPFNLQSSPFISMSNNTSITPSVLEWVVVKGVSLLQVETVCNQILKAPFMADKSNQPKYEDVHALSTLAQELNRLIHEGGGRGGEQGREDKGLVPLSFTKPLKQLEVEFVSTLLLQKDVFSQLKQNKCLSCPLREQHMKLACRKRELRSEIDEIGRLLQEESLDLYPEMESRLLVLERLRLIDKETGVPTVKGRVACQIMSGDELTLTELLFQNVLDGLQPEEIAAVLSAFVTPDGKSTEEVPAPTAGVRRAREQAEDLHLQIYKMQVNSGVRVNSEDWWKLLNFSFSLVAYEWASGVSFGEIMQKTNAQEGSIVRAILRLDELLRKIRQAAILIGDGALDQKMHETSERIHRDIVFAISLYLQ